MFGFFQNAALLQRPSNPGSVARVRGNDIHWIELGGGRSEAETEQPPPLVLLHGLGDSHRTWSMVASELARKRRVLMPDLAGHGLSARPNESYSLDWHAKMIGAWLFETMGFESVDLVGHSYGGGVAQWMLLEHSARVRKLGLVSSGGLGREVTIALRLAALPFLVESMGQPFMAPGTFVAIQAAARGLYRKHDIMKLSSMNNRRGSARAFARSVRDVIDWRGQRRGFFEHAHRIEKLPPTALFWGDDDNIIPISHAEDAAPHMNATVTRFRKCGHYPHREEPDRFIDALEAFLDHRAVRAVT